MNLLQRLKNYLGEERYRNRAVGFDEWWSDWSPIKAGRHSFIRYEYQHSTRGRLILKRASKLLAPPGAVLLINAAMPIPDGLNSPLPWLWEAAAVALVVAPIGTGVYPLMRRSIKKRTKGFVEWVTGS